MDDFNRYCKFQVKLGEIILLRVEVPSVCNRYVRFAALRSLMKYLQNCNISPSDINPNQNFIVSLMISN